MKVIVPFAGGGLTTATFAATQPYGARYVDVGEDDEAYWRLLVTLWDEGEAFIVVEHDIAPPIGALRELWECRHDWCAFPYDMGGGFSATALGCTKFSAALLARAPMAVADIVTPYRYWSALDSHITGAIRRLGEQEHIHSPAVQHERHYPRPGVKARRAPLTRLRHIGNGQRYLLGVPTADFETTDPEVIATAVESGLYEVIIPPAVAAEGAPRRGKSAPLDVVEAEPSAPADAPGDTPSA
jgi:hypothetical protein